MGPYGALHSGPWTSSAHTPALCPYAPWCAARARSHLGACLSDLVRKFAHVSGVRTQWPSAESRRDVGLGANDCVSSFASVSRAPSGRTACTRERQRSRVRIVETSRRVTAVATYLRPAEWAHAASRTLRRSPLLAETRRR
jgi:hypothetical protein